MKKYILIILSMFVLFNISYGQIIYNKAKPVSYGKQELIKISDLPTLKFTVDENGNLSEDNLNIKIKQKALIEKIANKYIARLKISLDVLSFGNITLRFSDIKLNNVSHCYVYTNDYQIVAGPIYSGAVDSYLNIVQIPAREMLIEIVFNESDDFDITLNSLAYQSVNEVSKFIKKQNKLQAVGDYVCPCKTHNISHYNIVDSTNYVPDKSQWLGYYANNQLFNLSKLSSITDYDFDASRAACIIMIPNNNNSYDGRTGTLMNFPYDSCKSSFVFAAEHIGEIRKIIGNTKYLNTHPNDSLSITFLKNIIIRFNWHHKYGTPLHLENTPCNPTNFALWRQTIDFSEAIDYCGARAFAYHKDVNPIILEPDVAILKMNTPTFYKEQHLGWTTQDYFDLTAGYATKKEDFLIMGRKAFSPTSIFENYKVYVGSAIDMDIYISELSDNYPINPLIDSLDHLDGWSGSNILFPAYSDTTQRIGLGTIRGSGNFPDNVYFIANTYYWSFDLDLKYDFLDKPLYLANDSLMNSYYFSKFANSLHWHYFLRGSIQDSCYYMPSLENKEKCPSEVGLADTCNFNINDYIATNGLCFNIDTIPENLFPNGDYPKGYRVYHNFADQKTLKFETFHSGNDITFPLEFCMDSCDLFYYMSKGMDTLDIAIDFYDEFGKIFNNIGCDTASFKFGINLNFCDFFHISLNDSCCENKITIKTVECDNASHLLFTMLDSLVFKNTTTNETTSLRDIDGITADYLNGEITFDYPFEDMGNCSIIASFNGVVCSSEEIVVKYEEE